MSTNKLIRIVLLLFVIGIFSYLVYHKMVRAKKAAAVQKMMMNGPKEVLVDGYLVKPVKLKNVLEASGTLQSNEEVELKPEINGRITHIYFKEGTYVTKGSLLVKLYDSDLKAQLQKLQLQKQLAEKTLARQKQLLAINGISQQEVDVTQNQVNTLQADIAYTQALMEKTEIRAPFDGIIGLKNVSEGAMITPTVVIANLQQINPLKIDFSVPEKYRLVLGKGDELSFTVAGEQQKYKGSVYALDPKIDLATRTVQLRAVVPNPANKLYPGMFAKVSLELKQIPDAIMIPTQAVIPTTRDKKVIVSKNGLAQFVTVETGTREEDKIQVLNGLNIGDTIVVSGIMQVRPQSAIKITHLSE